MDTNANGSSNLSAHENPGPLHRADPSYSTTTGTKIRSRRRRRQKVQADSIIAHRTQIQLTVITLHCKHNNTHTTTPALHPSEILAIHFNSKSSRATLQDFINCNADKKPEGFDTIVLICNRCNWIVVLNHTSEVFSLKRNLRKDNTLNHYIAL